MERANQKHILVLITNPFAIINVIHSGLMGELGKYYRISVMSDLLTAADIEHFNGHFRSNMHWLEMPAPVVSRFLKWLRAAQTLLFGHYFDVETIRIKLMERNSFYYRLFCISRKSLRITYLSGSLMVFIRNWLIRRTTRPELYASLAEYNFQTVISTSPLDLRENAVANSLKPYGIPCISIIISWDNLTSKGIINSKSDMVLVWNKSMALEYQRFYTIFGEKALVRIAGIPRFDVYFRDPPDQHLNLTNVLGINPEASVILFSTGAIKHHSCQNYIIRDLLEYANRRPDTVILVRCHPGDDSKRYDCFSGIKNLLFFQPFGENTSHIPPVDFLQMLHLQLTGCQVCLQTASTMLLDAAACAKPCISIAYDARSEVHYAGSVRRFYDYSHQKPLQNLIKEHIVYDRRELFEKLDETLAGTNAQTGPMTALKPMIHPCAPGSVRLTTQFIREWLG